MASLYLYSGARLHCLDARLGLKPKGVCLTGIGEFQRQSPANAWMITRHAPRLTLAEGGSEFQPCPNHHRLRRWEGRKQEHSPVEYCGGLTLRGQLEHFLSSFATQTTRPVDAAVAAIIYIAQLRTTEAKKAFHRPTLCELWEPTPSRVPFETVTTRPIVSSADSALALTDSARRRFGLDSKEPILLG